MACVTATEVKDIMQNCTLTDAQIEPFINSAVLYVNKAFSEDTTTSDEMLLEIQKWMTAHLIASIFISNSVVKREKIGDAEVEYASRTYGKGLESTPYGQMVLQLDTTGKLAKLGKPAVSIYAIKSFNS